MNKAAGMICVGRLNTPAQLTDLLNAVYENAINAGCQRRRSRNIRERDININNLEQDCWSFGSIFGNLLQNLFV